jgi:uncharacterized protein (DUF4415 family)
MSRERSRHPSVGDVSPEVLAQLEAAAALPDDQINTDDVPEVTDWSGAVRGRFYKPRQKEVTLNVDADVLAWFQSNAEHGEAYQAAINRVLRHHVAEAERSAAEAVPA